MPAPPPPFSAREVDKICYLGESLKEMSSRVLSDTDDGALSEKTRSTDLTWIYSDEESNWLYEKLWKLLKDQWPWLVKLEILQFSVYRPGGHFEWHNDNAYNSTNPGEIVPPTVRKRAVTAVIQLTDPSKYTGGQLLLSTPRGIIVAPNERGRMTAFSSRVHHKVEPVKTGVRKTLVCWGLRA